MLAALLYFLSCGPLIIYRGLVIPPEGAKLALAFDELAFLYLMPVLYAADHLSVIELILRWDLDLCFRFV